MKKILIILFLLPLTFFGQSITAPPGRTYQVNTSGQDASGFVVNGFTTETLLTSIGFVNPPAGVTFSITTTTGLSFATGYSSWSNITRVSFTGTQSNINNALATLKVNTSSTTGNVQISISATVNPTNYYYLPTNGHFYKYVSWPTGVSGGDAAYLNIKSAAQSTIFKGQTGYLVTITSSDEQNFIQTNVVGSNILIALTDRTQEGVWKWDAGPELGTTIKTANSGGEVSGQYNNWCSGEPNNWGSGENYVVTKWGGGNCWNDYGPAATNFPGSISGYVIEYGTWSNPEQQTFTEFYTANTTNTVAITNTLSGTVTIPAGLTSRPLLTLYRVVNGSDVLVDYKTVSTTGTYTFTLPYQNSTYKLVPSLTIQGITTTDFNLVWDEMLNDNTPTNIAQGLVITGTKQWKAVDVNKNGKLDLGDCYLISAHLNNYKLINEVLWFNAVDYDLITKSNFATINPLTTFTINVGTTDITKNIKYCILGDVNLSASSQ